MVFQKQITIQSKAFDSIYDITNEIQNFIEESGIQQGLAHVFNIGSTAAITTIEFEPGLEKDFPQFLNNIIPRGADYFHNDTWQDGNGDGHIKASLLGPDLTCPVSNGSIVLGTWQQIILVDSDNKPRMRQIMVTVIGE